MSENTMLTKTANETTYSDIFLKDKVKISNVTKMSKPRPKKKQPKKHLMIKKLAFDLDSFMVLLSLINSNLIKLGIHCLESYHSGFQSTIISDIN